MGLLAVIRANLFATTVAIFTLPEASAPLVVVVGLAGLGALLGRKRALRGTTLVAPWHWSLVSLLAIVGCEVLVAGGASPAPEWVAPLRFVAAMSTFCPIMALLGAKRPQDRAWQFIVFSLWVVLSLPAGEWLLFGGVQELHPAHFWFLVLLTGVGAANGISTRFWLSGLLYCAGQLALVGRYLGTMPALAANDWAPLAGVSALVLAWSLVALGVPPPRRADNPLDRVWRDFRDAFGAVWALRVAERINSAATMYCWPVRLDWRGFRNAATHEPVDEVPAVVVESLRSLLRRFVSPEWIDARLGSQSRQSDQEVPIAF